MDEFVNLLEHINLNEATVNNPADLPDGVDLRTLRLGDEAWNEEFKKYRSLNIEYNIEVAKTGGKGYVFYDGNCLQVSEAELKMDKVQIVNRQEEASLFTSRDAEVLAKFINSKTKDRNIKSIKTVRSTQPALNYSKYIFEEYFKLLCGDDAGLDYIRNAENIIYKICLPLNHPLVGNNYLEIFSDVYKNNLLRANWKVDEKKAIILNNLIADAEISSKALRAHKTFIATLLLTNKIYNYVEREIIQIIRLYRKISDSRNTTIDNKVLVNWKVGESQIAKQCIVTPNANEDVFKAIVLSRADDIDSLVMYSSEPSKELFQADVRSPSQIEELYNNLFPDEYEEKESKRLYLVVDSNDKYESYNVDNDTWENRKFAFQFNGIEFKRGDKFKIVLASSKDSDSERYRKISLLLDSKDIKQEDWFTISNGIITVKIAIDKPQAIIGSGTINKGEAKIDKLRFEDSKKGAISTKSKKDVDDEQDEEEIIDDSGKILIGGRSLDEIVSMSPEELETFKASLEAGDAKKLASFGRKFIFKQ